MVVLESIIHETIWGGEKLAKKLNLPFSKIGHLYSCYCRKEMSNKILNGEYAGQFLNDYFPRIKFAVGLEKFEYFPLTIALTEANLDLSIQVHPNDQDAARYENATSGKRESWYFFDAPACGSIVNGCETEDKSLIEQYIDNNEYNRIMHHLPVREGDYVFVEPGTLHAITSGSLVYEIEEGADATYRFYDYDRVDASGSKRELHTEKALQCLNTGLMSKTRKYPEDGIIKEKTYTTKKLKNVTTYKNLSNTIECFTLIEGNIRCNEIFVKTGMTVLLLPGEVIDSGKIELAFVAKYNIG